MNDYARIEKAMAFMVANAAQQPSLETVAAQVHLSAFHFQRLFCRYAGVSPKRFLQALTLERGKQLIASAQSLADTAQALGLSGGSRLYDHFVTLEAVTPGEFKRQGEGVEIAYGIHPRRLAKCWWQRRQGVFAEWGFWPPRPRQRCWLSSPLSGRAVPCATGQRRPAMPSMRCSSQGKRLRRGRCRYTYAAPIFS